MNPAFTLVSHALCPYVQRAAIVLAEKGVPFERRTVDLADKPAWFRAVSPLGRTPVLLVDGAGAGATTGLDAGDGLGQGAGPGAAAAADAGTGPGPTPIFESAVICEYLDDTLAPRLHPADPLRRARHRAWMEFGSSVLNTIAGFYSAPDEPALAAKRDELAARFAQVEAELADGPFFDGAAFGIVDAVFGPVFRYFDVFESIAGNADLRVFDAAPKVRAWRARLAARPSVRDAVAADYPQRLHTFLRQRPSALARRLAAAG